MACIRFRSVKDTGMTELTKDEIVDRRGLTSILQMRR